MSINIEQLLCDFHSDDMDISELKRLIVDFISDTDPDDDVIDISINNDNIIDVVLRSGKEVEFEIDWNELVLR